MIIPSKSRIHINNFSLDGYSVPSVCFQCPKPDCLEACPEGAIYNTDDGVVLVDEDKCNSCGDCVDGCPYGMIFQYEDGRAFKCDYCDGDPACVQECTPGAIAYVEEDKALRRLRGLQMKQRNESGTPEQKRHQLGFNILAKARQ